MDAAKYTPQQIASWFLCSVDRDAGDAITHLKLQKLVYYAQAWSLALFDLPLFDEEIEAWTHGPVVRSLFEDFRDAGWDALEPLWDCPQFDDDTEGLLTEIMEEYGQHSAKYLEKLTHREDPWKLARGNLPIEQKSSAIITKQSMAIYYRNKLEKQRAS
jgi:uncharacterized phage-associated protein